jgi:hypothetical protein
MMYLVRARHHPRREGDRQAAGNGAMSAAGGRNAKPLKNGPFVGSPNFVPKLSTDVEDAVPFPVVVVMIWQYMAANHSG